MNHHARPPARSDLTEAGFIEMTARPGDQRWQLIDGEPILMTPPTMIHQRISFNLAMLLDRALEARRPDLFPILEIGLKVDGHDEFRPVADVIVVEQEMDLGHYASKFHLAAEVLSDSDTMEYIGLKRERYAQAPDCLHVPILSQHEFAVEVWSRANDWQGRVCRSAEDVIDLPEFGFSCRLADLYRGTLRAMGVESRRE